MRKGKEIYRGKAKTLFETDDPAELIQEFRDDATAFDAQKRGTIKDKGICNNKISTRIFEFLETNGIKTHFLKRLSDREMLVSKVEIIPVEVTVRNRAACGMVKALGLEEGMELRNPVVEYHYKEDKLHDPLVNEDHIAALELATEEELARIRKVSLKINDLLLGFFGERNLDLIDFKLEFGRADGELVLADEISPDVCRLWEKGTGRKMDKDRFRRDLGEIEETYQEVLRRVEE